jgi:hypothetical protein
VRQPPCVAEVSTVAASPCRFCHGKAGAASAPKGSASAGSTCRGTTWARLIDDDARSRPPHAGRTACDPSSAGRPPSSRARGRLALGRRALGAPIVRSAFTHDSDAPFLAGWWRRWSCGVAPAGRVRGARRRHVGLLAGQRGSCRVETVRGMRPGLPRARAGGAPRLDELVRAARGLHAGRGSVTAGRTGPPCCPARCCRLRSAPAGSPCTAGCRRSGWSGS